MSINDEGTWTRMRSVITVDELAHGLRVNRKTAYEAVQRGEVPGVTRLGRVIRISRDLVVAWLKQGRVAPSRRK